MRSNSFQDEKFWLKMAFRVRAAEMGLVAFAASRQPSLHKPKFFESIVVRMLREEVKALQGRLCNGYGYCQWLDPGAM